MEVTARATRVGEWWAIEIPEVPGAFTQARRLGQIPGMVRDAVSLLCDVRPDDVDVRLSPVTDYDSKVAEALEAKRAAEAAQERASTAMRAAAWALVHEGHLTVRDAGQVLGLTPQRVSQLAK
ncbi:hypothetical protein [Aeromicrobium piscarium]|uniref:Uncharacterized protein n=1 Tax=Aeromicrobium piscarium TaxID=2590901 RepID=A0A554RTS4_9ACTN|nr:hypothetical protein [Aeromicrobium piscarium]TSD57508.1 hypothetical protein FNM00_16045 [Aeromicrobium piscarium]